MPAGPFTKISNVVAAKQIAFAAAKGVTLVSISLLIISTLTEQVI
jgi:hypothetical protein